MSHNFSPKSSYKITFYTNFYFYYTLIEKGVKIMSEKIIENLSKNPKPRPNLSEIIQSLK